MKILNAEGDRTLTVRPVADDLAISTPTLSERNGNRGNMLCGFAKMYVSHMRPAITYSGSWKRTVLERCVALHREPSAPCIWPMCWVVRSSRTCGVIRDLVNIAVNDDLSRKRAVNYGREVATVSANGGALGKARSCVALEDICSRKYFADYVSTVALTMEGARSDDEAEQVDSSWMSANPSRRDRRHDGEQMGRTQESVLAWSSAEVTKPLSDRRARTWLCAQIGAGDYKGAIENALRLLTRNRAELPADIALQVRSWISGYSGSEGEYELRELVERVPGLSEQLRSRAPMSGVCDDD